MWNKFILFSEIKGESHLKDEGKRRNSATITCTALVFIGGTASVSYFNLQRHRGNILRVMRKNQTNKLPPARPSGLPDH